MQNKILVAYTTNAGSTQEVAEAIGKELRKGNTPVDVLALGQVRDLTPYKAVVVGAPMILGWHRGATQFLKKHQKALSQVPVAYFTTALSLTKPTQMALNGVAVEIDPNLPKEPKNPGRLSWRERYTSVDNYFGSVLRSFPRIEPVSIGFFGGKLDFTRLNLLQMLFVMVIIQAQPGDRRNWPAIQKWAASLCQRFGA